MSEDLVVIGKFGAPHGVKGHIKLFSLSRPKDNIKNYKPLFVKKPGKLSDWQAITLEFLFNKDEAYIVHIEHCEDRDLAKSYTNAFLATPISSLAEPEEDEYYWRDLIGLDVFTVAGESLGKVTELAEVASYDVLFVQGESLVAIPFKKEVILEVDLEKKRITVDWDPVF